MNTDVVESTGQRMPLAVAQAAAANVVRRLAPYCEPGRCVVAGSIARECSTCGDIEIVCIPKTRGTMGDLFGGPSVRVRVPGFLAVCNTMLKIRGDGPEARYLCRQDGAVQVDIFCATPLNWGYILAIRTGSAAFTARLAQAWCKAGYHGVDGLLCKDGDPAQPVAVPDEETLFKLCGVPWVPPRERNL